MEDGIEAMLCCWLQELHEFGGPEVDKPDLLKGPDDSVKSFPLKHVNSSNSVTKPTLSTEIKARYNVRHFEYLSECMHLYEAIRGYMVLIEFS